MCLGTVSACLTPSLAIGMRLGNVVGRSTFPKEIAGSPGLRDDRIQKPLRQSRLDRRSAHGEELRWLAPPLLAVEPTANRRWPAPPYWRPARPLIGPRRGTPLACPPLRAAELTQSLARTVLLACTLPLLLHAPMCEEKQEPAHQPTVVFSLPGSAD